MRKMSVREYVMLVYKNKSKNELLEKIIELLEGDEEE
jgi:hypothetical protein